MRKRKKVTFKDIENTPEYKDTRDKVCKAIASDLPLSRKPEDIEATADIIFSRMRELFASAFPGVELDAAGQERIAAAEKKARDIFRRSALPGLYQ